MIEQVKENEKDATGSICSFLCVCETISGAQEQIILCFILVNLL